MMTKASFWDSLLPTSLPNLNEVLHCGINFDNSAVDTMDCSFACTCGLSEKTNVGCCVAGQLGSKQFTITKNKQTNSKHWATLLPPDHHLLIVEL